MLVGEYSTYKGIFKASVVEKSGLLFLESNEKGDEFSFPLIPENEKLENLKFYTPIVGGRMAAEFVVETSGKVDLYFERNRFHKIK